MATKAPYKTAKSPDARSEKAQAQEAAAKKPRGNEPVRQKTWSDVEYTTVKVRRETMAKVRFIAAEKGGVSMPQYLSELIEKAIAKDYEAAAKKVVASARK